MGVLMPALLCAMFSWACLSNSGSRLRTACVPSAKFDFTESDQCWAASRKRCSSVAYLKPLQLILQFWYDWKIIPLYDSLQTFCPFVLV